jgi:hypothetical protein
MSASVAIYALPSCPYAGGGVLERHPAEERALDPDRVARHSLERDPVPQQFLVGLVLAVHQPAERLRLVKGLGQRPPEDLLGHHRRGRLGDRAALAVDGHGPDPVAVQPQPDRQLVAAHRVVVVHLDLGVLEPPRVPGLPVVVEDDLLVEVVEAHVIPA